MNRAHIICGFHAVLARLRAGPASIGEILLERGRNDARAADLIALARTAGVKLIRVPGSRLDGLAGGRAHQGVAALVDEVRPGQDLEELLQGLAEPALLLVLDGVTDPRNLGACLRVADAAGAHAVIAPKDRAAGPGATVSKAASGAAETVPYFMVTNLARTLDELKRAGVWVVGADERAPAMLYEVDLPASIAWVLGAEGEGMRRLTRERCDTLLRIPMHGSVASLNVSVASGLCLFESRRRRLRPDAN